MLSHRGCLSACMKMQAFMMPRDWSVAAALCINMYLHRGASQQGCDDEGSSLSKPERRGTDVLHRYALVGWMSGLREAFAGLITTCRSQAAPDIRWTVRVCPGEAHLCLVQTSSPDFHSHPSWLLRATLQPLQINSIPKLKDVKMGPET